MCWTVPSSTSSAAMLKMTLPSSVIKVPLTRMWYGDPKNGGQTLSNLLHQKVPASDKTMLFISLSSDKKSKIFNCYLPGSFRPPTIDLPNLITQLKIQTIFFVFNDLKGTETQVVSKLFIQLFYKFYTN